MIVWIFATEDAATTGTAQRGGNELNTTGKEKLVIFDQLCEKVFMAEHSPHWKKSHQHHRSVLWSSSWASVETERLKVTLIALI